MARRLFSLKSIGLIVCLAGGVIAAAYFLHQKSLYEQFLKRLRSDSRIAEVLVTGVAYDESSRKIRTTIKFLEYDAAQKPLEPRYFTFIGNIIQFQSLVVRFEDAFVLKGDAVRGKSLALFWKVFMLDGTATQEYVITPLQGIPAGYLVKDIPIGFQHKIWRRLWAYALHPARAKSMGIKNVQIEAPGTMFVPGYLYTIKIEHDGGMRIDAAPLPAIVIGETILNSQ